jgi:hypothetical protein
MEEVYLQLSRYITPVTIFLGTIGALSNQILFHFRKPLRTTSCALYFRALSANDLLTLWFVIFPQWLNDQFNIDASVQSEWYCKFSQYLSYVFYDLSPFFLALACFDRLCTSSTNARLRKIATRRIASIFITSMIIIIFILYSYVPIYCHLVTGSSYTFCAIIDPTYARSLAFCILFFFCLLPPSLMITFCIITLILLRQQRRRIMPVNQVRLRHRDNQLIKMLFIYVISNIVCFFPFTVTYMVQIYYYHNVSPFQQYLVKVFTILLDIAYATSFYMYTLGTPFYRDELRGLLQTIWQRFHRNENTIINLQPRRNPNSTTV